MAKKTTLHDEIREILKSNGNRWMTTDELASTVNRRGRYRKRDGSPLGAPQIHARTIVYSHLFERDGPRVRTKSEAGVASRAAGRRNRPLFELTTHRLAERAADTRDGASELADLREIEQELQRRKSTRRGSQAQKLLERVRRRIDELEQATLNKKRDDPAPAPNRDERKLRSSRDSDVSTGSQSPDGNANSAYLKQTLERMRTRLLDTTRRNRLINYRESAKDIPIVAEMPDLVFDRLFTNQRSFYFDSVSDDDDELDLEHSEVSRVLPISGDDHDELEDQYTDNRLQTPFSKRELALRLRKLYLQHNTLIKETGANGLFLAMGFLDWKDSTHDGDRIKSPLMLVPVRLEKGLGYGAEVYKLEFDDEALDSNYSLLEKIRHDHSVRLPQVTDETTPEAYWGSVERAIVSRRSDEWHVVREVSLGLFRFHKQIMWHDLDSDRWPSDARLIDKPIVQRLLLGPKPGDVAPGQISEEYATEDGEKIPLVCDADSSQYSAIFDALRGKESLVVEGPPGTGKSQTITNLIAAAIGQGKTVLFVAEKMEALRVVYERLENMGLDDFCLQLHGLKTKKIELLESIKARTKIDTLPPRNSGITNQELSSARTRLVSVSRALAKVYGPEKVALHDIFWRIERLRSKLPDGFEPVESEEIAALDYERFSHVRNLLNDLAKEWSEIREDARQAWQGFLPRVQTTGSGDRVLSALQRIAEAIDSARQSFAVIGIDSSSFSSTLDVKRIRELGKLDPETSFPALPMGIPVDITYNIVHGGDIDAFHGLTDSVSSYLSDIADANRVLDYEDERTQAFAEQLDNRCSLLVNGFLPRDVLIGDLSERQEESKKVLKSLDDLAADAEPLLLLLDASPRTLDDYERLAVRAKQYIDGPQTLSLYASPIHAQSATVAHLDSARGEYKRLLKILNDRLGAFRLMATSKTETLSEAYEYLETKKDSWFPFIDRQYRASQRVVCSVLKNRKTYSLDRQFLDGVAELVDFCLARDQFSNSKSAEFLGPLFLGIDTDWNLLEEIVSFSQVLRRDLGLETSKRVLEDWAAHLEVISECRRNIDRTLALAKVYAARHNLPKHLWKRPVRSVASTLRPWVSYLEDAAKQISLDLCSSDASLDDALRAVESFRSARERESLLESNPRFERLLRPMWQRAGTDIDGLRALDGWFNDRLRLPCVNVELLQCLFPTPDVLRRDLAYKILEIARSFRETLSANLNELTTIGDIDIDSWIGGHRISLSDLHEKMQACVATIDYLPLLFRWSRAHSKCLEMGLGAYSHLVSGDELKGTEAGRALEYSLYALIAKDAVENEPLLRDFSRSRHESFQNRFANLDRRVLEENAQDIGARLCRNPVPAGVGYGPVRNYSEKRLLDHEAGKQKQHIPIRQLVLRASAALKALKPCFLMSPLSVAQYLPPGTVKFDLVIMDEASQIRPEDALGAMARADKAIIVGDPKQLPPTSFFDSTIVADDSAEETIVDDTESILDVCLKQFPFRRLRWHYRSQHEDLIQFSNEKFYNGDLIVFPSARGTSREFGVHYTKVPEPSYKHGRNRNEAELIVENIVKHYRQFSDKSLGVAAFNRRQAEEIQALLDNRRINDPVLDELIASRTEKEPLFIKNLENVQGDERDVIFISTTYGPEQQGAKTFQRFGPINSDLGWRRLNVIATRARQRVEVFSSMRSSDVLVGDTARKGVRALRDYLEYAETGRIAEEISVGGEPENDFEVTVGKLICDLGYEVAYQVGVAGFFIDIGVRHPDRSGEYLMGVECDGATYHSARSIRDRDRLRQTILESKGWSIHRIWSTNWFHARVAEVDRLADALAQQLAKDRTAHARPVEQADELIVAEAAAAYSTVDPETEVDDQGLSEALDRFWKTNIAPISPDRSRSILSEPIVDRIVAKMPETRGEWIESVPLAERERVEARQGVFLEDILEIVWDHVQALQSRRRDNLDDAKDESQTHGSVMPTRKEKEFSNRLA